MRAIIIVLLLLSSPALAVETKPVRIFSIYPAARFSIYQPANWPRHVTIEDRRGWSLAEEFWVAEHTPLTQLEDTEQWDSAISRALGSDTLILASLVCGYKNQPVCKKLSFTQQGVPVETPSWVPDEETKKRALRRAYELNGNRMVGPMIDVSQDPVVTGRTPITPDTDYNVLDGAKKRRK